jgi:predicted DNA-binding transcriptional regulator AlpA
MNNAPTPASDSPGSMLEPLLDAKRSAEVLGISSRMLWSLTNAGAIPCVRLGRAVRYDPADLRKFIAASKSEQAK